MGDTETEPSAVRTVLDAMPLLKMPRASRRTILTTGAPLDFYGAADGKLHANGGEFHIKGIKCARLPRGCSGCHL